MGMGWAPQCQLFMVLAVQNTALKCDISAVDHGPVSQLIFSRVNITRSASSQKETVPADHHDGEPCEPSESDPEMEAANG